MIVYINKFLVSTLTMPQCIFGGYFVANAAKHQIFSPLLRAERVSAPGPPTAGMVPMTHEEWSARRVAVGAG